MSLRRGGSWGFWKGEGERDLLCIQAGSSLDQEGKTDVTADGRFILMRRLW